MKTVLSTYEITANEFLAKTKTSLKVEFLKHGKHFTDDKDSRDIYKVSLTRGQRNYTFDFGQSINNSQYFQDKHIKSRTYTTSGAARTGNYKITNLDYVKEFCTLIKGTEPTAYDVLVSITKYDPGTFEDFCSEFEYDTDSKKAEKTYNAVKDGYMSVCALFSDDELNELQEIQ